MFYHIVPKLFHLMANKCTLESVSVPELKLTLEANAIKTCRPFPNKNIWSGMIKGRKTVNGILIKSDKILSDFTVQYIWNIEGMGLIKHKVTTWVEDQEYDLVSQDILLNHAFAKWESRTHASYRTEAPVYIQPMMESYLTRKHSRESHDEWTEYEWGNFLNKREESLLLHTIQSERLSSDFSVFHKVPCLHDALTI